MKALKYEISGGLKILTGFADLQPDPEATREKVEPLMAFETEFADMYKKVTEIEALMKLMLAARKASNQAANANDAELKYNESIQYSEELKVKQGEMKPLKLAYLAKRKTIAEDNLAYFEPSGANEIAVDESVYTLAKTALKDKLIHTAVSVSDEGNVSTVPDFRGCKHWVLNADRWESGMVALAGDVSRPVGAIWDFDLNLTQSAQIADQSEGDRVTSLSVEEKDLEQTDALNAAIAEAASRRSQLEIQGVSTALEDSQAWYQAEVDRINLKYA